MRHVDSLAACPACDGLMDCLGVENCESPTLDPQAAYNLCLNDPACRCLLQWGSGCLQAQQCAESTDCVGVDNALGCMRLRECRLHPPCKAALAAAGGTALVLNSARGMMDCAAKSE